MFYWKYKTEAGTTLKEELLSCGSVSKVMIASAFLSTEGVCILRQIKDKYSLPKESITLYLSAKFSTDKPHEILEELSELCILKIIFDQNFHSKVYLLRGNPNKLIYGSSNFTGGGMIDNVEFNFIGEPSLDDVRAINTFFDYCGNIATDVTAEVIQYYKNNQAKIKELHHSQKKLSAVLKGFTHQNDAFLPEEYDLTGFYFNYVDYETFFLRNRKKSSAEIKVKREQVQSKMLNIHKQIYPEIKKMGIAHHKRKENITSLIIPHPINQYTVGWLGVRYGKTSSEVDVLSKKVGKGDDIYGFQKHGCLQYSIGSNGFEINLFLAVRHAAIDRDYLHENLGKLKSKIELELIKLKNQGMQWVIWNNDIGEPIVFDVDSESPSAFCDFFKTNDMDGRESYLRKYYEPNDKILQTKETIGDEIKKVMKLLLPLYNTMVWRLNV